jgi:hypothetical protein
LVDGTDVLRRGSALEGRRAEELEGVVCKPLRSRYRPGERGWLKLKNRAYWKYELERLAGPTFRARSFSSASV